VNPASDRGEAAVALAVTRPTADHGWDRRIKAGSLDVAPMPTLLVDGARRVRLANQAAAELLGLAPEALSDSLLDDLFAVEAQAAWDAAWARFVSVGYARGSLSLERADGAAVEVQYSAIALIEGELHLVTLFQAAALARFVNSKNRPPSGLLSRREREVLGRLARGAIGPEVARELGIAPDTVRRHVLNAREKLGARSRAHAIALALDRGEIALVEHRFTCRFRPESASS
jgi:DNA-binding CsgD family transcriptional regulator